MNNAMQIAIVGMLFGMMPNVGSNWKLWILYLASMIVGVIARDWHK